VLSTSADAYRPHVAAPVSQSCVPASASSTGAIPTPAIRNPAGNPLRGDLWRSVGGPPWTR